jgi:hypothetical protein
MITGESLPVLREVGDEVIGGTLNTDGRLIVRVARVGRRDRLAQIVKLVDRAQSSKPPVQKLADQGGGGVRAGGAGDRAGDGHRLVRLGDNAQLDSGDDLGGHRQRGLQRADHRLPVRLGAGGAGGADGGGLAAEPSAAS